MHPQVHDFRWELSYFSFLIFQEFFLGFQLFSQGLHPDLELIPVIFEFVVFIRYFFVVWLHFQLLNSVGRLQLVVFALPVLNFELFFHQSLVHLFDLFHLLTIQYSKSQFSFHCLSTFLLYARISAVFSLFPPISLCILDFPIPDFQFFPNKSPFGACIAQFGPPAPSFESLDCFHCRPLPSE